MSYYLTNSQGIDGVLQASILSSATSLAVTYNSATAVHTLAAGDYFLAKIGDEIVSVTDITGDVWTITRAQKGTTATAHTAGDAVKYILDPTSLADAAFPTGDGLILRKEGANIKSLGVAYAAVYNQHTCALYFTRTLSAITYTVLDVETNTAIATGTVSYFATGAVTTPQVYGHLRPDGVIVFSVFFRTATADPYTVQMHMVDIASSTVIEGYYLSGGEIYQYGAATFNRAISADVSCLVFAKVIDKGLVYTKAGDRRVHLTPLHYLGGMSVGGTERYDNTKVSKNGKYIVAGGFQEFGETGPRLVRFEYDEALNDYLYDPSATTIQPASYNPSNTSWDKVVAASVADGGRYCGYAIDYETGSSGACRVHLMDFDTVVDVTLGIYAYGVNDTCICGPNDEYLLDVCATDRSHAYNIPAGTSRTMPLDNVGTFKKLYPSLDGRKVAVYDETANVCYVLDVDLWTYQTHAVTEPYGLNPEHIITPSKGAVDYIVANAVDVQPDTAVNTTIEPAANKIWVDV